MELRLYSFVNYYFSSIQQGIQTGHAAVDLVRKYSKSNGHPKDHINMVYNWADNHKTFITLNGGNSEAINNATGIIEQSGFPYVEFFEDEKSLCGMQTCVVVIVPETIFNAKLDRSDPDTLPGLRCYEYTTEDAQTISYCPGDQAYALINLIKNSRLSS